MVSGESWAPHPIVAVPQILTNVEARKHAVRFLRPRLAQYGLRHVPLDGVDMWAFCSEGCSYGYSPQFDRSGAVPGMQVRFELRFYVADGPDVWDWADVERFGRHQSRFGRVVAHLSPDRVWVGVDSKDALLDALEELFRPSLQAFERFVSKHGGRFPECLAN